MQRIILRQLKESVHRLQGASSPEIARYYQAYKREFRSYEKISSKTELLRAVKKADVVFGADFHPFAQSQRTHLRILRELVKSRREVILALEAVDSRHQKEVDLYLENKIDDKAFLKKINYSHSWGFPWDNYKVLFDFARHYGIEVAAINQTRFESNRDDLSLRDLHSARKIVALRRGHPQALIYVIYGDLHLASTHLPKLTRKFLGRDDTSRFLTIFQNSESLYWRLAAQKLEERVDVLKLRPDAYCVVNSPPWLKWQAYLNFLEQSLDEDEGQKAGLDLNDQIAHFVRILQQLWGVEGRYTDFHVYFHGDGKIVHQISRRLKKRDLSKVIHLIRHGRSVFLPSPPIFYFQSPNVNHVVELAGQYLHAKIRREREVHFDFPKDFVPLIWIEAVGFFASKMVNSRRKFLTVNDLSPRPQVKLLVLEQRLRDQMALRTREPIRIIRGSRSRRANDYMEAARVIGALIGNKMYKAFRSGRLDQDTLGLWLRTRVDNSARFYNFYVRVLGALKNIPVGERSKNERL